MLVDTGNLLFKNPLINRGDTISLIKAEGIARGYSLLHYDAVAVSASDLSTGLEFFRLGVGTSLPWLSANIIDEGGGLLFPAYTVKKIDSLDIGIIGLTGKGAHAAKGITIGDWQKALEEQVKALENRCDLLVVLSNLPEEEHYRITKNFPQIDLVIGGSGSGGNVEPIVVKNSLLAQSGSRGKYIGKLEIEWIPHGKWRIDQTQSWTLLTNKLDSIDRQIDRLAQQQKGDQIDPRDKLARMKAYRATLAIQLEEMRGNISETTQADTSTYISTFLPVRPSTTPAEMQRVVLDIKQSINAFNRGRRQPSAGGAPSLQAEEMGDVNTCRACHPGQVAFWQHTAHARAFATLTERGQSYNLDCLPCHVTGGDVGPGPSLNEDLSLLSLPENRKTISCAVCHGPSQKHALSPGDHLPVRSPQENLCKKCHTVERDADFHFSVKISKVACPAE